MVLLIDNYDSFTYMLRDYLLQLNLSVEVVRNDALLLSDLASLDFEAIVISPGPKTPQESGLTLSIIEKYHREKPILGICLGHQALGQFLGARLVRATRPMHGKTSSVQHNGHPVFNHIPSPFEAMRYHSLALKNLPDALETIAIAKDGTIMGLAHREWPLIGLQFHPESILTPHGLQLLSNWHQWYTSFVATSSNSQ